MAQSLVYVVNALCTLEKKIYFADIEWCPAVLSHSHVWLFVTPWTVARQAPLPMEILQVRILEWVAMPSSRGSSQPRNQTQVSHIPSRFFTIWATKEVQEHWSG